MIKICLKITRLCLKLLLMTFQYTVTYIYIYHISISNPGSIDPHRIQKLHLAGNLIQTYPMLIGTWSFQFSPSKFYTSNHQGDRPWCCLFLPGCCAKGWCGKSSKHRVLGHWDTFRGGMWSDRMWKSRESPWENNIAISWANSRPDITSVTSVKMI